jgi:predicted nucleotidyltransferase
LLLADRVIALVVRHPGGGIELAGSRAMGQARPDSDWDLLVETRDFGLTPGILLNSSRGRPARALAACDGR